MAQTLFNFTIFGVCCKFPYTTIIAKKQDMSISQKNILITGGAGFIGSNLCDFFIANGNKVTCLDSFITGKRENIAHHLENENFTLIEGDIRDRETCIKAAKGQDYILHEAALGSVPRSINDPVTSTEINISGFVNMLYAAVEAKVKRFVYAASSSTYGDSKSLPKEEDIIGNPLSPYAITKYVNELYAKNFSDIYGIETIGLRYFNVYGRRQDPNGAYAAVIPKFTVLLMKHMSPVINGDGSFSRDFTYVEDVVQANHKALLADKPEALNTVYNVAFGGRTDLKQLVAHIQDALLPFDGQINQIPPKFGPFRSGDIPHSHASIEKAKKLLGYEPKFSIKDGINEAVKWYWEHLQ